MRDNVPVKVNAVIWQRVIHPEHAVMEVREVANAVIQVSVTTFEPFSDNTRSTTS
jgi:hypothetical protein